MRQIHPLTNPVFYVLRVIHLFRVTIVARLVIVEETRLNMMLYEILPIVVKADVS